MEKDLSYLTDRWNLINTFFAVFVDLVHKCYKFQGQMYVLMKFNEGKNIAG